MRMPVFSANDFDGLFELNERLVEGVGVFFRSKGSEEEHFVEVTGDDSLFVGVTGDGFFCLENDGAASTLPVRSGAVGQIEFDTFAEFSMAYPVNQVAFEDVFGDEDELSHGFIEKGYEVDELVIFLKGVIAVKVVVHAFAIAIVLTEADEPMIGGKLLDFVVGQSAKALGQLEAEAFKADVGEVQGVVSKGQLFGWVIEGLTAGQKRQEQANNERTEGKFMAGISMEWHVVYFWYRSLHK